MLLPQRSFNLQRASTICGNQSNGLMGLGWMPLILIQAPELVFAQTSTYRVFDVSYGAVSLGMRQAKYYAG